MAEKVSFDQALERCLRELARVGDVEAILRRYPQYASRLRPLLEAAQMTRRYYEAVPEPPGGLAAGRERLLAMAAQQRARTVSATPATRTAIPRRMGQRMRLALATRLVAVLLAVIAGTAVLGAGAVWAAEGSLPGDLLYPVKLAAEDVRLALTSAPADQVDLALRFVERRTEEVRALSEAGRQVPDETTARMEAHIEHALTQTAWASDEEMSSLLTSIAERTRAQAQLLEQVQATAPQQARPGLAHAVTVCQRGAEAAEDGLNDPQAFRRRYRHQQGASPEPAEGTPQPTNEPTGEPELATATPGSDQEQEKEREQERYRQREQEHEGTPVSTPRVTPHGPQATPVPQATPHGPQPTAVPHATSHSPQPTAVPQATPHEPQATSAPKATPTRPR
jgi:AraC-like DNA-binding protein